MCRWRLTLQVGLEVTRVKVCERHEPTWSHEFEEFAPRKSKGWHHIGIFWRLSLGGVHVDLIVRASVRVQSLFESQDTDSEGEGEGEGESVTVRVVRARW